MSKGAVYIAYGTTATMEAHRAQKTLRAHAPMLPMTTITDYPIFDTDHAVFAPRELGSDPMTLSRAAKVNLYMLSPYAQTLYMDADTSVYGDVGVFFRLLSRGFDLVITPSQQQGSECLWHVGEPEKRMTLDEIGFTPLQLQGGVFAFRRSPACETFFARWQMEWTRWRGQDQAALLRALYGVPLKVALVSHVFNGGAVIAHHHGKTRV